MRVCAPRPPHNTRRVARLLEKNVNTSVDGTKDPLRFVFKSCYLLVSAAAAAAHLTTAAAATTVTLAVAATTMTTTITAAAAAAA